ncbi:uncharacterized protein LOC106408773 [Brassica napus]|uniref:uncharacterized protein LOC106408773 n=1 Tax=Brassica napus TaxID=3708 RepID=UPI0006AB7557|nr:uncharacterized protein LOC106408773 [Brassica napus]
MTDPSYSDDKRAKRYMDMLQIVADSDYGIPRRCPCGGQIVIQICNAQADIGKKYFICKAFEDDGLHRKKEWDEAIEEETEMLRKKVDGHERRIRSLNSMENRINIIEEDEKNNAAEIDEIKYFLKLVTPMISTSCKLWCTL